MSERWIKLYEKIESSSIYHDSELVHLWVHLLIKAQKFESSFIWNGEEIVLKPGQLLTGRKQLSLHTRINESKIQRALKTFENCHMIEQQTTNKNRIISILNWDKYQTTEQQTNSKRTGNEQVTNNKRTTNEHIQESKKDRKKKVRTKKVKSDPPETDRFISSISEATKNLCKEKGIRQLKFKQFANACFDHFRGKGEQRVDWEATVRNWIRNDEKFNSRQNQSTDDGSEAARLKLERTQKMMEEQR